MTAAPKKIVFEEEARQLLLKGIKKLADVIAHTLGPRGRNVGLEKSWGAPTITNDGNSIVKEIELEDPYENMGVSLAKEVAQKIKEKSGDGTTTGTLILYHLVENGIRQIASGASPIGIKRGIEKAIDAMINEIKKMSIPVKNSSEIENIATVSASGHHEIGKIIAEAVAKVGNAQRVTIEESKTTDTSTEVVEGMQFDRGYISAYFCTNPEKMTVEMSHPYILIADKKINNIHEILQILQNVAATGKDLLIIADDIEGDALSTLVVNKLRGTLKVAAVKAPGFGDRRKALCQDIAVFTAGDVVSDDAGVNLKDLQLASLGSAEKVTITKEGTTIIGGKGQEKEIQARLKQIDAEIAKATNNYDKEKLQERYASLSGGIAEIRVGAATEPELKQKKQMFEDSLHSTRAAMEDGIVIGGGVALLRASQAIDSLKLQGDEAVGAKIVKMSCQAPLKQIAANCGMDGSVVLAEVLQAKPQFGFNALTGKVEDLEKAGVIDPAKVVKNCLLYASSVAGIVLISEALIADEKEEEIA